MLGRARHGEPQRMPSTPRVSIVIATFNRARLLGHAIASVRRSTIADWEVVVVGDACTDDTPAVVAAFEDPRLTFVNLPANAGEQSAPNNEGVTRARGRYLAFLNHDDLYFPDHLESAIAHLEREQADLVWSPLLVALPASAAEVASGASRFRLSGVPFGDDYDPRVFVFASAWVFTRELAARVGPWRSARDLFVSPSQDWLFRAWRSGARMRFHPRATVLAVPSSARDRSYLTEASPEHDYFAAAMAGDPRFRDRALEGAAITGERDVNGYRFGASWLAGLRGLAFRPVAAVAMAAGVHPYAPFFALRYGRRGNLVSAIRRKTGLSGLGARPGP
jgi:glycosyltransferase involved in cell wall biosynthesis